jgi:hypothetical protein
VPTRGGWPVHGGMIGFALLMGPGPQGPPGRVAPGPPLKSIWLMRVTVLPLKSVASERTPAALLPSPSPNCLPKPRETVDCPAPTTRRLLSIVCQTSILSFSFHNPTRTLDNAQCWRPDPHTRQYTTMSPLLTPPRSLGILRFACGRRIVPLTKTPLSTTALTMRRD